MPIESINKMRFNYYIENTKMVNDILAELSLDESFSIPLSNICFCLSLDDDTRKMIGDIQKHDHNIYSFENFSLAIEVKINQTFKSWFNIDEDKLDKYIEMFKKIGKDKRRINYKTYLSYYLSPFFYQLNKDGKKQIEQIEIVFNIFRKFKFEDYYSDDNLKEKKDRIRKIQEKAIKDQEILFGK